MNVGQQMFILASKEMSFSRAAEKAFVTPQCLSEHIKRLEEQYQVVLFHRRPQLRLTEEGEILLQYFLRIQALETSMQNELADRKREVRGVIRLGIPATRGILTVPKVVARFREFYPQVDLQVFYDDTQHLEEQLLEGRLDVFLGVDASQHVLYRRISLGSEPIYLVVSEETMERHLGGRALKTIGRFRADGADLNLLQEVPFVQGSEYSTSTLAVRQYLLKNDIDLRIALLSSNFDVQAELCKTSDYATMCPRFYVRRLIDLNEHGGSPLYAFRVRGFDKRLEIELISRTDARPLQYLSRFFGIVEEVTREEDGIVCDWLTEQGIGP